MHGKPLTYASAGVDVARAESGLARLLGWLDQTHAFPGAVGRPVLKSGFFAAVHDLGHGLGLAISTDNVGTKSLVAQMMGRYEEIGSDCVAVNVNDVLCVGARPIALVDYLAVEQVQPEMLEQLGKGLYEGARQAGVAIAGGEMAQVPELLRGAAPGAGFDLSGTCVGIVALDRIVDGRGIQDGDVVVGFRSSGIHCNGLTLARAVLLGPGRFTVEGLVPELGCTLGEELLRPCRIYVRPVLDALERTQGITGLAHISGDGFLNLLRFRTPCGFELTDLPEPQPIFRLVQQAGSVPLEEMYQVYNMGVGFCVVARPEAVDVVLASAQRHGYEAQPIGHARAALQGRVALPKEGLVGEGKGFRRN
ncbi:MAG: phosphoribosylformylglycinamidine cyclo-ligase [Chloroflexi bacterium]|nr:phosphoribosylformylglycinamidine cyclo-ligase [Chloroflexota bacterium]